MAGVDWSLVKDGCPRCGRELQWHSLTVWCLRCGWAKNWEPDPATGRPVERRH